MRKVVMLSLAICIPALAVSNVLPTAVAAPACTIEGSAGGEVIIGTRGRDVICARGGGDWIDPRGGNDVVLAGPGDDFVRGSAGSDILKGDLGRDYLVGGPGADQLFGAAGSDRCLNLRDNVSGNDRASGGPGYDNGTRDPGDMFTGIEQIPTTQPYCRPAPPRPPV